MNDETRARVIAEMSDADVAGEDMFDEDLFDGDVALTEELKLIATDARAFAQAELAFQKARGAFAADKAKSIAILGVVAAVFGFFAVMAAVVGTVIALGPVLGLWGAMAAVTVALLVIVAFCALLILLNVRDLKSVLAETAGDDD